MLLKPSLEEQKNICSKLITIFDSSFVSFENRRVLYANFVETQLGMMLAICSETKIYLLEFVDKIGLSDEIKKLKLFLNANIILCNNVSDKQIFVLLQNELTNYFLGNLKEFSIPVELTGTEFQKSAWNQLKLIPYGHTVSYKTQAIALGRPSAYRAVAGANSFNKITVIIPCHRVVNSNGKLGGYSCGIERKKWLLNHEKNCII